LQNSSGASFSTSLQENNSGVFDLDGGRVVAKGARPADCVGWNDREVVILWKN
jgi:hypothetical protein